MTPYGDKDLGGDNKPLPEPMLIYPKVYFGNPLWAKLEEMIMNVIRHMFCEITRFNSLPSLPGASELSIYLKEACAMWKTGRQTSGSRRQWYANEKQ